MNSHVQISKCIIKQFRISDSDGKCWALDLKTKNIIALGTKKIGTDPGYYDDDTEIYLSSKYETGMGNLIAFLKQQYDQNLSFVLSDEQIDILAKFLTELLARDPVVHKGTEEKAVLSKLAGIKVSPSMVVRTPEKTNLKDMYFGDAYPVVVFNLSNKKFVSSVKGYSVNSSEETGKSWWFPLTPEIGINYIDNKGFVELYKCIAVGTADRDIDVESLNDFLSSQEINRKGEYIFGSDKAELERIKLKFKI